MTLAPSATAWSTAQRAAAQDSAAFSCRIRAQTRPCSASSIRARSRCWPQAGCGEPSPSARAWQRSRFRARCSRTPRSRCRAALITVASKIRGRPSVTTRRVGPRPVRRPRTPVSRVLTPQSKPSAAWCPLARMAGAGRECGRSTAILPLRVGRRVGVCSTASGAIAPGSRMSITCQAQSRPVAGAAHRGSLTRNRAVAASTRARVTCWRSIAARSTSPAACGGPSNTHSAAGGCPCSAMKVRICRVRLRISAPLTPADSSFRSAAHPASVRRPGSAGQTARTAATMLRRCRARRRVRAAYSSAPRRTRSGTYTPARGVRVCGQFRRRIAIQPLDGRSSPRSSTPAASMSRDPSSHRAATKAPVSSRLNSTKNPTRSSKARCPTRSPVPSTAPRNAVQAAVATSLATSFTRNPGSGSEGRMFHTALGFGQKPPTRLA